ncbi:MAG: helix-turn-helix transcriptional regulator [Tepidisphaeraceae bacterium]|jgi:ribosome-binding protein aMBF1 (putative translation factor)
MKPVATLEIKGERYAVVPLKEYRRLVSAHGAEGNPSAADADGDRMPPMPPRRPNGDYPAIAAARVSIARDVIRARRAAGLSQAELARRAGIRVETLNRIEKAKVTADVATMEKIDRVLRP